MKTLPERLRETASLVEQGKLTRWDRIAHELEESAAEIERLQAELTDTKKALRYVIGEYTPTFNRMDRDESITLRCQYFIDSAREG